MILQKLFTSWLAPAQCQNQSVPTSLIKRCYSPHLKETIAVPKCLKSAAILSYTWKEQKCGRLDIFLLLRKAGASFSILVNCF
jgi:hypothetical protein